MPDTKKGVIMKKFTCPDCGKVFQEDSVPNECSNCGCPSSKFVSKNNDINKNIPIIMEESKSKKQSSNFEVILASLAFSLVIGGGICGVVYQQQQHERKAEQARYEHQERARVQREEAEERKREQENERFLNQVVGTYVSQYFNYGGQYVRYRIELSSNQRYSIKVEGYNYSILSSQSGRFSPVAKESGCVLNPNSSNSSWIDVKSSSHIVFGGYDLYKL